MTAVVPLVAVERLARVLRLLLLTGGIVLHLGGAVLRRRGGVAALIVGGAVLVLRGHPAGPVAGVQTLFPAPAGVDASGGERSVQVGQGGEGEGREEDVP